VQVSLSEAYKMRRIYMRLAKMRGERHLRRLTVFVRYENVLRLSSPVEVLDRMVFTAYTRRRSRLE